MDPLFPASYPNLLAELCAKAEGRKTYDREDSEYCLLLLLNYRKLELPYNNYRAHTPCTHVDANMQYLDLQEHTLICDLYLPMANQFIYMGRKHMNSSKCG